MNNMPRHLCALVMALLPFAASAAEISVLPVGLGLSAQQNKSMITVSNMGKESVVVQADTLAWEKPAGKNHYSATSQLLVNPPVFTIPAGQSQVLRVGLRNKQSAEQETAYRLMLREVPAAQDGTAEDKPGNIKVLLQLSLPIYVAPAKPLSLQKWKMRQMPDGSMNISLSNQGNVHILVNEFNIKSASAIKQSAPVAAVKANEVIFPGQEYSWTVPPQAKLPDRSYVVEVKTDKGQQNVAVDLEPTSGN